MNEQFRSLIEKTITIDVDGVSSASDQTVTDGFNERFGTRKSVNDIKHWNSVRYWAQDLGYNEEESKEIEWSLWFNPEVLGRAKPVPGSYALFKRLDVLGVNLLFITGRPSYLNEATRKFFTDNFPFIDTDKLILNKFEDIKEASEYKIQKIIENKPLYHIDDSVSQAAEIVKATKHTKVIIVPNHWNEGEKSTGRIIVTRRLEHVPNLWPVYLYLYNHRV